MRVSFSSMTAARGAVRVLEAYGYSATQIGQDVLTDCPTLLAVPAIERSIGLELIERLDLKARAEPSRPDRGPPDDSYFPAMGMAGGRGSSDRASA